MTQRTLFDDPPSVAEAFTDAGLTDEARPRLGGQNALVLQRLRQGPATNIELEQASGSKRINSRVADVRRWLKKWEGATVESTAVDVARGVYQYEICRRKDGCANGHHDVASETRL